MPIEIDWDDVPDTQEFAPIPAGKYRCTIQNVDERMTAAGDKMWSVEYVVNEGMYSGRKIFDNIVFSSAALPRAKLWSKCLGFNVTGKVQMTPGMVRGRPVILTVFVDEYQGKKQNKVEFGGFEAVVPTAPEGVDPKDVPF